MKVFNLILLLALARSALSIPVPGRVDDGNTRVPICFEKKNRKVNKKNLSRFLANGATRGKCPIQFAYICVNGRKTRKIKLRNLETNLKRPNVTKGKCKCKAPFVKECANGKTVRKNLKTCQFPKCPSCKTDKKKCPNGRTVGRDINNKCQFRKCPEPIACTADAKRCPDGSFVSRDPKNDCKFPECPEPVACTDDAKQCPDGSFVSRDPKNKCQFRKCPPLIACTADVKRCPDGSFVSRDSSNKCEFRKCPTEKKCCKESDRPPFPLCREGCGCCPDGTWAGSIGDGQTFPCNDELLSGDALGEVCEPEPMEECCPADNFPLCLIGTAKCCPNGTWTCPNGKTGEFTCGGKVITRGFGEKCKGPPKPKQECCDPAFRPGANGVGPICSDGAGCCPDGTWSCGIGGGAFPCGGLTLRGNQLGEVCDAPVGCGAPSKICPDGSIVNPDPKNGCKLPACPPFKPKCCDSKTLALTLCRSGVPKCCAATGGWVCPIGKSLRYQCGKNTITSGFGKTCPTRCLQRDIRRCPDGTVLIRDPKLGCQFPKCPVEKKCCPNNVAIKCATGPSQCCPDGTLTCPLPFLAAGTPAGKEELSIAAPVPRYQCGGKILTSGFSKRCPNRNCCAGPPPRCPFSDPRATSKTTFVPGPKCCPNEGGWSCPDSKGLYKCNGNITTSGFGNYCK